VEAILVTGNPGSGKSAVATELTRRGFNAVDPDDDPALSQWQDASGLRVEIQSVPDEEWLRSHRWVWRRQRLEELLAAGPHPLFVCGIAGNQHELLDLFAQVFLLAIDDETQVQRLVAYDRAHPPGRSAAGRQEIREGRSVFEGEMIRLGATPFDARLPTQAIVDEILARLRPLDEAAESKQ
jgi:hypothetical protein